MFGHLVALPQDKSAEGCKETAMDTDGTPCEFCFLQEAFELNPEHLVIRQHDVTAAKVRASSSVWIAILTAVTRTAPYEDGRCHGHNNNNNKNRRVGRRRRRNGSCFFHVGNDTHTQVQTGGGPQQTTPPARRTKDLLVVLRLL